MRHGRLGGLIFGAVVVLLPAACKQSAAGIGVKLDAVLGSSKASPGPSSSPSSSTTPMAPVLASLSPSIGAAGSTLTISGKGLSQTSLQITVGGKPAKILSQLEGSIQVAVPAGARTGYVRAQVGDLVSSVALPFTVVSALTLNSSALTLLQGKTSRLGVSASDDYGPVDGATASWAVTLGNSVTVDASGQVSATGPGDAIVGAAMGTLAATASVHVFSITGVTLNPNNLTLGATPFGATPDPGFQTSATMSVVVTTSDGSHRGVSWSSSDTTLVLVDSSGNLHSAQTTTPGTAIITATSLDDPTKFATASVSVSTNGDVHLKVQ